MPSRAEIRSDLELRISGGKPSDDLELDSRQIDFWIDSLRNKLIEDKLATQESNIDIDAAYATMFDCVAIQKEDISCGTDNCNTFRYYINLPGPVVKLKNDAGIVSLRTIGNHSINRIRITDLDAVKYTQMLKPSDDNMVYYRSGKKLYILGPSTNFLNKGVVMLVAVLSSTVDIIGDDDEFPIPGNMVPAFIDALEAIARRQMQTLSDLANDGK